MRGLQEMNPQLSTWPDCKWYMFTWAKLISFKPQLVAKNLHNWGLLQSALKFWVSKSINYASIFPGMFVPVVHNCQLGSRVLRHLLNISIQLLSTSSVLPAWLEAPGQRREQLFAKSTIPVSLQRAELQHSPGEGRHLVCLHFGKNHNRGIC